MKIEIIKNTPTIVLEKDECYEAIIHQFLMRMEAGHFTTVQYGQGIYDRGMDRGFELNIQADTKEQRLTYNLICHLKSIEPDHLPEPEPDYNAQVEIPIKEIKTMECPVCHGTGHNNHCFMCGGIGTLRH